MILGSESFLDSLVLVALGFFTSTTSKYLRSRIILDSSLNSLPLEASFHETLIPGSGMN